MNSPCIKTSDTKSIADWHVRTSWAEFWVVFLIT